MASAVWALYLNPLHFRISCRMFKTCASLLIACDIQIWMIKLKLDCVAFILSWTKPCLIMKTSNSGRNSAMTSFKYCSSNLSSIKNSQNFKDWQKVMTMEFIIITLKKRGSKKKRDRKNNKRALRKKLHLKHWKCIMTQMPLHLT